MGQWLFDDPRNVAVFTVRSVWEDRRPILYVFHDHDDGAWQFHVDIEPDCGESSVVALEEIVRIDPTIMELADLPLGWCAWREAIGMPWERKKMTDA